MVMSIRLKELHNIYTQQSLYALIQEALEAIEDISGERLASQFVDAISEAHHHAKCFKESLYSKVRSADNKNEKNNIINNIGNPIYCDRSVMQLFHAHKITSESDDLISDINRSNILHITEDNILPLLPTLGASEEKSLWGNRNISIINMALTLIAAQYITNFDIDHYAHFYPFRSTQYKNDYLSYIFARENGCYLFGDYQLGGHKYFTKQNIYLPEDCSSAVGKSTNILDCYLYNFNSYQIVSAYGKSDNIYGYRAVTKLEYNKDGNYITGDISKIEPGDIFAYLYPNQSVGHAGIIASHYDTAIFQSLEFIRNVGHQQEQQKFGGGINIHNLMYEASTVPIYILSPQNQLLHEAISLSGYIEKIDMQYQDTMIY